jgi:hypothetical protein
VLKTFNKHDIEIVKADIYYRRRVHYAMFAALLILFAAVVLFPDALHRFVQDYIHDSLARLADFRAGIRGATDARVALNIFVLLAMIWGYFFIVMVWVLFIAARMLRAPQWPLPQASVMRDTRVHRGLRLKLKAWLMILIPLALIAVVTQPVIDLAFGAWEMYTSAYAELKTSER